MLTHLGVQPAAQKILALKSSVHFRADFQPIAGEILIVAAPGANPVDHRALEYRHLRPGLRLMPQR
jgi:microcystin degradation protein MlrC